MKIIKIKVEVWEDSTSTKRTIIFSFGMLLFKIILDQKEYFYLLETLVAGGTLNTKGDMTCPILKYKNKYIELTEEMFNTKEKFWYEEYETTDQSQSK